MKKIFSFLLVSAAVLAMAACQKEQQVVDTPENGVKEVTTQFVLNIAARSLCLTLLLPPLQR